MKKFKISQAEGLKLLDTMERDSFVNEKINRLLDNNNFNDKSEMLNLLHEFLDMYDSDCKTATFDSSEISDTCFFEIENHREKMIATHDLIFMLGNIFRGVYIRPENKINSIEDGTNGPVSTAQMFKAAYEELKICDEEIKIPYGANLILATLIEKDLKTTIKVEYAKEWLILLQKTIDDRGITMNPSDLNHFNYLKHEYGVSNIESAQKYDSVFATTIAFYDLLCRYNIINNCDKNTENLIKGKFTLNQLLKSHFSTAKIQPDYLRFINILFSANELNLRNNLAHCNFGYINYQSVYIGWLLLGLFIMISNKYILN